MSIITARLSNPNNLFHKKSYHKRNCSGELNVFEAANYFSGPNVERPSGYNKNTTKIKSWKSARRVSLDMGIFRSNEIPQQSVEKTQITKEKKTKQPNSPGGRLASFLNSLFNQTGSRKTKSKSTMKDLDEENHGVGRRKRRSSISHFGSSSSNVNDSKSFYGFRSSPSCYNSNTPTKVYNNNINNNNYNNNSIGITRATMSSTILEDEIMEDEFRMNIDKQKSLRGSSTTDNKNGVEKDSVLVDDRLRYENWKEIDDGADSDSSSDLFELQNYDLISVYSTGLPVYETTSMDIIKKADPIYSRAL